MPISRKALRWTVIISIAVVILTATTFLATSLKTAQFNRTLRESSSKDLMERGREYYRNSQMDSALMVFSYLADNYDADKNDEEKHIAILAKNNVGIIYSFEYMDYPRGYEMLKGAYDLAEQPGFENTQAILCHNIIELLRLHSTCLNSDNVSDRIADYTRTGVEKALEGKEYKCLASIVICAIHNDINGPLDQLEAINNPDIPDTVEGVSYARRLLKAATQYQNGQTRTSIAMLDSAFNELPAYARPLQYIEGHKRALAQIYASMKEYPLAERYALDVLHSADSLQTPDAKLLALSFLATLPIPKQKNYEARLLQVKDSVISKGRIQMVNEIDFIRSLNSEREENRRITRERTRLYWGLGIGGVLIIIFALFIFLLFRYSRRLRERNASLYAMIQKDLQADAPAAVRQPGNVRAHASSTPRPASTPSEESACRPSSSDETQMQEADNTKYAGSSLSQERMDEIQKQLLELLNDEAWVCDPDVSLARTASRLEINTTYLSRVINERFGMSLSALLSQYRIRIASRRMAAGSSYANQTIESIARSVGYSSRSSFIAAFKKINGMTPSEYLKLAVKK